MSKLIPLFRPGVNAKTVLAEALEKDLTELVMIGKLPDGTYWVRLSPCNNIFEQLGVVARLRHEINITIDENS
jgi:hypothetical protein